jgi:hypothetical protein
MIKKTWTSLIILIILFLLNSCKDDLAIKNKNDSYLIHPENSSIDVDLRLGENRQITSFSIKDDSKNFSMMFNLLEDGNCSLKLNTDIYEQTVNTDISPISEKCISQYIVLNNKIYLLQEIDNNGQIISKIEKK